MAIAVVNYTKLLGYAASIGFPLCTKVPCQSGMNGYLIWDKWIRDNVEWVSELGFDPADHVKITESAQLVGELKSPWELRCQKFVEGDAETNTFQAIKYNGAEFSTHVNRQAIQVTVSNASLRYKLDFETEEDGTVVTHNRLAIAVFHTAEDSSLSYQSDIEVAQLWTTKVEPTPQGNLLYKRAYAEDPTQEATYPWIAVGYLTTAEYEEWVTHNVVQEATIEQAAAQVGRSLGEAFTKASDHPIISITKESIALPTSEFKTIAVAYPESDQSAIGGDV